MTRLQTLIQCFGLALCDKGRRALVGELRFGDVLMDVAKATLHGTNRALGSEELRIALGDLVTIDPKPYEVILGRVLVSLAQINPIPFKDQLQCYLSCWPATVRQVLRRPSDPMGHTAPHDLVFYKPEDLLVYLPPRMPVLNAGATLPNMDDWVLTRFLGMGESSEVWMATSEKHPEISPAALKFATDKLTAQQVIKYQNVLVKVFGLNEESGVVPLRSVYLETNPPCLDVGYVHGYDLTGLLSEWHSKYEIAKPEASLKLVQRLTQIIAKAHRRGIVHRDLKPSNIFLHPREKGKFTMWVTDFGWGQIAAVRPVESAHGKISRAEQLRLELRGAYSPLYASPQQIKQDGADPRDDVYAIGVIWHQLLKRSPSAQPPVGTDWADEFRTSGFPDDHAKLLSACLSARTDKRPANAEVLAEQLSRMTIPGTASRDEELVRLVAMKSASGEHAVGTKSSTATATITPPARVAVESLPKLITNTIGMTFALIPPGTFQMGSPDDEPGHRPHEAPVHEITITKPFYLSVHPVTQSQFTKVCGFNPSHFNEQKGGKPDFPVEFVTWNEAGKFCEKLEQLTEEEHLGRVYRLPTEAEWEYACRAGEAMPYFYGQKLTGVLAHFATNAKHQPSSPCAVGQFAPNAFGLYDMHGNVLEWVQDWYNDSYYWQAVKIDPQGPDTGTTRVTRGGCWLMFGTECRSGTRRPHAASGCSNTIGFRVALNAPEH